MLNGFIAKRAKPKSNVALYELLIKILYKDFGAIKNSFMANLRGNLSDKRYKIPTE